MPIHLTIRSLVWLFATVLNLSICCISHAAREEYGTICVFQNQQMVLATKIAVEVITYEDLSLKEHVKAQVDLILKTYLQTFAPPKIVALENGTFEVTEKVILTGINFAIEFQGLRICSKTVVEGTDFWLIDSSQRDELEKLITASFKREPLVPIKNGYFENNYSFFEDVTSSFRSDRIRKFALTDPLERSDRTLALYDESTLLLSGTSFVTIFDAESDLRNEILRIPMHRKLNALESRYSLEPCLTKGEVTIVPLNRNIDDFFLYLHIGDRCIIRLNKVQLEFKSDDDGAREYRIKESQFELFNDKSMYANEFPRRIWDYSDRVE